MERSQYDTLEGIRDNLVDLRSFKAMINERHEAYYTRKEPLNDFLVLGTWHLDSCGNTMKATKEFVPRVMMPHLQSVVKMEWFWQIMQERWPEKFTSFGSNTDLPSADIVCPYCSRGWSIDNCHDAITTSAREDISLREFVGLTLAEAREKVSAQYKDRVLYMQSDIMIRNDKHIDHRIDPECDYREINKCGYLSTRQGLDYDNYVVEEGDEGHFNVRKYYHAKCFEEHGCEEAKVFFTKVFIDAGFDNFTIAETKNEYCSCSYCWPWWDVFTKIGAIRIGWRKRVINIDTSGVRGMIPTSSDINVLMNDEDVTKWPEGIHAHGRDKAVEYLKAIKADAEAKRLGVLANF